MDNMELNELFNETQRCHFMDTSVNILLAPLCVCALVGIVTFLAYQFFKKRLTIQNVVRVNTTTVIKTHTSFLSRETESCETKLAALIEKSEIDTGLKLEDAVMDIKTNQQDCANEILAQSASLNRIIGHLIAEKTAPGQEEYVTKRQELIERTKKLYRDTLNQLTISPLNNYKHEQLTDVYMPLRIVRMVEDKGVYKKTDTQVTQYKDMFLTDNTVNPRIFLQGEAGSGKTTFLSKLALDWCGEVHVSSSFDDSSPLFSDVDVIQGFVFVFHITLRNSVKQFDVYTMIKEQIIDSIYSHEDREKAYRLLNEIMKCEQCLVLLDGLDEWAGPGDHHNLPTLVVDHSKCVMLFSTRPWKLAVVKITHSDRYTSLQLEGIDEPLELSRIILSRLMNKEYWELDFSAFEHYIAKQELEHLLSSPIMLSVIVCSYAEGTELKGSKCIINTLLLESLFKKANSEMCTFEQPAFLCFTGTQYIKPNMEPLNRLAELAFHLLFVNVEENSLVFSDTELRKFKLDERKQKEFALKSGILSSVRNASTLRSASSFSFIHLSMQEFLAAYHIARNTHLIDDVISVYLDHHKDAYRDISQVFIFLCGLDKSSAETLSSMMDQHHAMINSRFDDWLQTTNLAGHREAVANGQNEICLRLSHFDFDKHNIKDLHRIWTNNAANALSLIVSIGKVPFENRQMPTELDLSLCRKLKKLQLLGDGILLEDSASVAISEFPVRIVLNSTDPSQCTDLSSALPSIERIGLSLVGCSFTWLCSLISMLLTLDHKVTCELFQFETSGVGVAISKSFRTGRIKIEREHNKIAASLIRNTRLWEAFRLSRDDHCKIFKVNHKETLSQTLPLLLQLDKLSIEEDYDNPAMWQTLHGLNITSLSYCAYFALDHTESLSQAVSSLKQLEILCIEVQYDSPGLWEALRGLHIKSLFLHGVLRGIRVEHAESLAQTLSSLTQLESLSISVDDDTTGLLEALYGLNIKTLSLSGYWRGLRVGHAETLSQSLSSLKQLEKLTLYVNTYIALQVPQSLKYLYIYSNVMLPSKLRDLVDTLAACTHTIQSKLDFGCASCVDPLERVPTQEYMPIQQEMAARNNVAVEQFRIYEWPDYSDFAISVVQTVRDIGDIAVAAQNNRRVRYDFNATFAKFMYAKKIHRISMRLHISPDSV